MNGLKFERYARATRLPWITRKIQENIPVIFPLRTGFRIAFPCFIPMHIGYTACTIREQFGYRYAETACKERSELYGDFGTN